MHVTLFTQEGCGECETVAKWLKERGIDYKVKGILHPDTDRMEACNAMACSVANGGAMPVLLVNNTVTLRPDEFRKVYARMREEEANVAD